VAARLANGDAFLATRKSGYGNVMLACCGFEKNSANLVTRQTFVPMLHQLVYHLASPEGQPLQRQPGQSISIPLASSSAEGGLKAEYFKGQKFAGVPFLVKIEPQSKLQYGNERIGDGLPADDYSVRLTGSLTAKYSEEYVFDGWGDDSVTIWINDKLVFERGGEGRMKLEAGKPVPIKIDFVEGGGNANFEIYWRSQSQQRENIGMDCLTPFPPSAAVGEAQVGMLNVSAPDGSQRVASLVFTRSGLAAKLQGDIVPGIYRMQIPKESQKAYARLLAKDGTIPFSVTDDSSESKLTELTKQDWEFFKSYFPVLEPKSAKEVNDILAGREFGEELWKYLALGALFILLAEIALTRWIALSRRSGEEQAVDFEHRFQAPKQFQEQLNRIKQTALN
jgi:PA14 domain